MSGETTILKAAARYGLEELAARLTPFLEAADVERAVVFGSYARGEADLWSDLDLVVVVDTDLPFTRRGEPFLPMLLAMPVGVDLLVYTPEEYRRGIAEGRGILAAAAREGRSIHARAG